ncbi:MAG TPA: DUF4340 domain-containing protein [Gemmataceae bacterium]|nr:DUF4340 domain-containing protein [Gemmataceae bacterium]
MNLKTTLVLVVLVVMGGVLFVYGPDLAGWFGWTPRPPDPVGAQTLNVLANELKPQSLTRIEIRHSDRQMVLQRAPGGEWTLPGRWPTRKPEVEQLVGLLTNLRSRFAPIPLTEDPPELHEYGLDKPAVTISVTAGGKEYVLQFGEEAGGEAERFSRPTYLRLREKVGDRFEDKPEVVRLAPGLITELTRPIDYYQQRRLFPSERVAKENDPQEKVEQLAAKSVVVIDKKNEGRSYRLDRIDGEWLLTEPHRDRLDPDKRNALLTALPDVWAEKFIDKPDSDLSKYGLEDPPQQSISVTKPDGQTVTLIIGKESRREAPKPPPEPSPFAPPPKPQEETIYHYAKLQDNSQIFEIKFNPLQKDVLLAVAELRDPRVARFRTTDVRRIELTQDSHHMVFVKEKENWRLEEPIKVAAENSKVNDLLFKLSNLEAKDKDAITYKADPKVDGLDKPAATVKLTIEEAASGGRQPPGEGASGGRQPPGDESATKTRTITVLLGKREPGEAGKLFVKQEGWDRISKVSDDGLLNLVKQPVLAFRSRRILDFNTADLAKVEIQRGDESYALTKSDGTWKLAVPGEPEADRSKVTDLTDDLSRLEAVEYVSDVKPEEHGLDKPALTVTLTFTKEDKKPQKLLVGKQRGTKQEYYAKLDGADEVFVIRKQIRDDLDRSSLAYRPLELWQVPADQITSLTVEKEGEEKYTLTRKDGSWQISGPFEAAVKPMQVQPMTSGLATLRGERYETHAAKDLTEYGLDKPYLRVTLTTEAAKPGGEKDKPKERVLLIGSKANETAGSRFAKLGDSDAVFVVDSKVVAAVDHGPLDLLDRQILTLEPRRIERIQSKEGETILKLERKGESWQVVESLAGMAFPADKESITALLNVWSPLQAQRIAAYGPKADPAKFGLDQPAATVTVTVQKPAEEGKQAEPVEHTLALGKEAENGGRYARLDNGPAILLLSPSDAGNLMKTYLDFVDRTVLKLDAGAVAALVRQGSDGVLEVVKRDDGWQIIKPAEHRADDKVMQDLLARLGDLRAKRIAAYPAKDLKPFGLEEPAATLTLRLAGAEGKAAEHTLRIGKTADESSGDRFVQAAGSPAVAVLPGALARQLTAGPLAFRDRNLVRFTDADRAILERGPRKAVFAKVEGTWKLVEPVEAEAEQSDLEDLINALARLRADELVAEKPGDLKPYGLDRPELRWRFQSGDRDMLNLVIGAPEKDGPRRYAKVVNSDLIFLLDSRLTERLLAEYRSRSVWPMSLDAAQVETVTYRTPRGSFTLEKVDGVWQAAGKPDMKLNAQTVNETLAALAGLRVVRYVQDTDTDLNLYGLEPPEVVVEAETRTGKRLLHLGRPEGESKRRYARLPDKGRPGVFVIAEADAEVLVRDLTAFTREPTRPSKPAP